MDPHYRCAMGRADPERERAVKVTAIHSGSDLKALTEMINTARWDADNAISEYDAQSLERYLAQADTLFLVCHDSDGALMGMASSRFEMKPYGQERWLYVDELDVCADQRRRGAGRALMRALLDIAEEAGCEELWLGADADNAAANALYHSLDPDVVEKVVGFTYELD